LPVTLLGEERPVIVTGFKRIDAARRLGIKEIPCVFVNVDEKRALLAAITDNAGRSLNTMEKLRCVERMSAFHFPTNETYEIFKIIGLPTRERTVETALAAAVMKEEMKAFVVCHRLPVTAVEQLLWFDSDDRDRIVEIIDRLDVTVSSFREVLQLMMLVSIKQGRLDFGRLAAVDSMGTLKRALKRTSHPALSGLESALTGVLKSCALPPNIKVHVDPYFEKDWIDFSVRARNSEETGHALKKLEFLLAEGLLGSLFELTHGLPVRN